MLYLCRKDNEWTIGKCIEKNTICLFPAKVKDLVCLMIATEDLFNRTEALVHEPTHVTQVKSFLQWPFIANYHNANKKDQEVMTEELAEMFDSLFDPKSNLCIHRVKELIAENTNPASRRKFQRMIEEQRKKFTALTGIQRCYFMDLVDMWSKQDFRVV
ncbi:hypothetical protein M3Y95_00771400 [Aphelenchoides besseyi]|nr:hypothetical protein M3Y95_00771400 [Aphelenchoides besseyi]